MAAAADAVALPVAAPAAAASGANGSAVSPEAAAEAAAARAAARQARRKRSAEDDDEPAAGAAAADPAQSAPALPNRWLACPRKGGVVPGTSFVPLKTPLDSRYDRLGQLRCCTGDC